MLHAPRRGRAFIKHRGLRLHGCRCFVWLHRGGFRRRHRLRLGRHLGHDLIRASQLLPKLAVRNGGRFGFSFGLFQRLRLRLYRQLDFKLAAQLGRNIRLTVHILHLGRFNGHFGPPAVAEGLAQRVQPKGAAGAHLDMLALRHRHSLHGLLCLGHSGGGRLGRRGKAVRGVTGLGNGFARGRHDIAKVRHNARRLLLHRLLDGLWLCRGLGKAALHRVGAKVHINIKRRAAGRQCSLALFAGSAAFIVLPLQLFAAANGFFPALTRVGDMLLAAFHGAARKLCQIGHADGEGKIDQQCQRDQNQDQCHHLAAEGC